VIQRTLYNRILGHIRDDGVRQLAHPGLVLRRLTARLIVDVLAAPCGLGVRDETAASELLELLAREVSVGRRSDGGAVVHRADLHGLMLPLLEDNRPQLVRDIRDRVIEFYRDSDRAEEIYHRLARGDDTATVDGRWLPGAEDHLRAAVDKQERDEIKHPRGAHATTPEFAHASCKRPNRGIRPAAPQLAVGRNDHGQAVDR